MLKRMPTGLVVTIMITAILFVGICVGFIGKTVRESYSYSYDVEWIVGKSSLKVEEFYGPFDQIEVSRGEDGLLRRGVGSYIIRPSLKHALHYEPELLFSISFDENGFAWRCFEETGGKGG